MTDKPFPVWLGGYVWGDAPCGIFPSCLLIGLIWVSPAIIQNKIRVTCYCTSTEIKGRMVCLLPPPSTKSLWTMERNTVVSFMGRDCVCTNCFTEGTLFPAATEMFREHFLDFRNHFFYKSMQTFLFYLLHFRIQSFTHGLFDKLTIFYLLVFNAYQVFSWKSQGTPQAITEQI